MGKSESRILLDSAAKGDIERLTAALEAGADPNATDTNGRTALMLAARRNHIDVIRRLLEQGADINRQATFYGWTALSYAARAAAIESAQLLLSLQADTEVRGERGKTPLQLATMRGDMKMVNLLLESGANPNPQPIGSDVEPVYRVIGNIHTEATAEPVNDMENESGNHEMLHFRFQLRPVSEIGAWGSPEKPTLHWFGLTDGWFWIEVNGQELFRYTEAALEYWGKQYPNARPAELPYSDYPIVRYWEDLIEMLPAILEPLPDDLGTQVADTPRWAAWQERAQRWHEAQEDLSTLDVYDAALRWWWERKWGAGHLSYSPQLWLWRVGDIIHIRWDNRDVVMEGIPVWTAQEGEILVPVSEFREAVRFFDECFITAMAERVETLLPMLPLPGIYIDGDNLTREQKLRAAWLGDRLKFRWDEVRAGMAEVEREIGGTFSRDAASPDTGSV